MPQEDEPFVCLTFNNNQTMPIPLSEFYNFIGVNLSDGKVHITLDPDVVRYGLDLKDHHEPPLHLHPLYDAIENTARLLRDDNS